MNTYTKLAGVTACKLVMDTILLDFVNRVVPESYMDEPFHVDQTQEYCNGNFHKWDPKITTFPGLYLVGIIWNKLLTLLQSAGLQVVSPVVQQPCGTTSLRWANVIMSAACLPVIARILNHVHQPTTTTVSAKATKQAAGSGAEKGSHQSGASASDQATLLWALTLSCMPLHWFYTYLYYTDVGSTLFLLLCYEQTLTGRYLQAGVAGAAALLFRQTNAVWVAFILGATIVDMAVEHSKVKPDGVVSELASVLKLLNTRFMSVASSTWPLLLTPMAFVAFLVHNKGVTLGDKEAHKPVVHPAQLVYFSLFTALMLAPVLLKPAVAVLMSCTRIQKLAQHVLVITACSAACYVAIKKSPEAHAYLLSDNRHYTFYIWRRLVNGSKVWQIPAVITAASSGAYLICREVLKGQPRLWLLGFWVCLAAVLVPAWLLEFRYYTAGFMLLALHLPVPSSRLSTLSVLCMYLAINAASLYMFLYKSWVWYDGRTARFMW